MTISELKKHIYENEKIEYILSELGCHNIRLGISEEYYSASFPDGDNPQGINIRNNEYLDYRSFSRNVSYGDGKDIIDLVQYITGKNFVDSVKYLHNLLGLDYTWTKKKEKPKIKIDPLEIFKKVRRAKKTFDVGDIKVLDESVLADYSPLLHIDWFREGVMPWTAKKFGIAYSYRHKRVVMPMRHWMTGELLGVNMRTTIPNYKEFGISKFYITPTYQKSMNLFGLYENYESIQKAGYVVVYESEKSVLKRDSLNDSTGVALSGKSLSDEQVRILIGLNVDIIISLDNDVPIEEVRHMCERFYNIRNVYFTHDEWDLLDEKDSIADKSSVVFDFLMKYKFKYNEEEHIKYLEGLNK